MKNFLRILSILSAALMFACCSSKDDTDPTTEETLSFMVSVPSTIEAYAGDSETFSFYSGKGPLATDKVVFKTSSKEYVCSIKSVSSSSFTFTLDESLESGSYSLYIRRGTSEANIGKTALTIIKANKVEPKDGYNLYGQVTCDGTGLAGVLISDGVDFTKTDADGIYYLKSDEKYQNVFMVIPSGYEAEQKGVFPQFTKVLDGDSSTTERADFALTKVSGQDKYTMVFVGDMHLAKRNKDLEQFHVFTKELNDFFAANSANHNYVTTLGDMTWDLYWYTQKFAPSDYVTEINSDFDDSVPFFHCIGNHDHEMGQAGAYPIGDYACEKVYRTTIAPTYYSYNIGKIHYMVIDDIYCTNPGTGDRTYDLTVTADQLSWIKKDLSYVDKTTPLVVITHAPLYTYNGSAEVTNLSELLSSFEGYKVYFITGHTHREYNIDKMSTDNIMELNSGAVCATWWWTGYYTSGLYLERDGSNGGYRIFEVNGTDVSWYYKSTGKDKSVQFRTYDGNQIYLSASDVPNASSTAATAYENAVGDWGKKSTDNYVYIEVWDYDPEWKIEVTENGNSLTPTRMALKDPLHFLAYEAKRYNAGAEPTSSFTTFVTPNIFRVKASSANSTIDIKVTDRFGRTYSESMTRPKAFNLDTYK